MRFDREAAGSADTWQILLQQHDTGTTSYNGATTAQDSRELMLVESW